MGILRIKRLLLITFAAIVTLTLLPIMAEAGGISFDAGLTPPEDRWILRTQVRFMQRKDDPLPMNREMSTFIFPFVLAYGLRPELTIMLRQTVLSREMSMTGTTEKNSGLGDLFVLAKYRAYRLNTPDYTFGIAPTLGLESPSGDHSFTSETWDIYPGLYISWRRGLWAADSNIAYKWNGFVGSGKKGTDPGDELSLNLAFAYQFRIGERARSSLAPVLEFNYYHIRVDKLDGHDISNTGETVMHLSSGIKFTTSSLILEALLQNPIRQLQKGYQLERDVGIIVGSRFLF